MTTFARDSIRNDKAGHPAVARERNNLLSALSANAMALLRPALTETTLTYGAALWEPGSRDGKVYFPLSGLVSVVMPMGGGESIEVATVAREGAAGGLFDPVPEEPATRGIVQIGGQFAVIDAGALEDIAIENRELGRMVEACRAWIAAQAQQLAACNAVHAADKRLCRWLFHNARKMDTATLHATQDMIGTLLGIRRTTVTLLAQSLHTQGLIDYARGKISVREPARLKASACECCGNLGPERWPSTRLLACESVPA